MESLKKNDVIAKNWLSYYEYNVISWIQKMTSYTYQMFWKTESAPLNCHVKHGMFSFPWDFHLLPYKSYFTWLECGFKDLLEFATPKHN